MRMRNLPLVCLAALALFLGAFEQVNGFQLGGRAAKEWIERLERPDRVAGLKVDEVISGLKLKTGDTVTDIGAGTGVFSRALARAVAPTGKLLAVDVDQDLLDYINERAKQENISNIQTVLGKFDDPNLPSHEVDLAFFHDVLHHIEQREAYLKALASYLTPTGRIVVIDMIQGHKNEPEMQITVDQVKQWMAGIGFHLVEEVKLFDDKFFVIFGRNP